MKLPEIIGIAGGNGSGKDTLADVRAEVNDAQKIGLSDLLRAEAINRGLDPKDRLVLSTISTEWAALYNDPGFLSIKAIETYRDMQPEQQNGLSVVSIRRLGEAAIIQQHNSPMIWIEADIQLRYENTQRRARPGDRKPFDVFKAEDDREMYGDPNDPLKPRMIEVKEAADIHVENNFDSKKAFEAFLKQHFELVD